MCNVTVFTTPDAKARLEKESEKKLTSREKEAAVSSDNEHLHDSGQRLTFESMYVRDQSFCFFCLL